MEVGALLETELAEAQLLHSVLVGEGGGHFAELSDAAGVCDTGHAALV